MLPKSKNFLDHYTKKIYYEDQLLRSCRARVVKVSGNAIELDQTVAFPEGGGQEGDHGTITTDDGLSIPFCDTQKMYGRPLRLQDFPNINVEALIHHIVADEHVPSLARVAVGSEVHVSIDTARRERHSIYHTAAHLIFIGVETVRPELIPNVKGCHITETGARFDFMVDERFSAEQVLEIAQVANRLVAERGSIELFAHAEEPEAWYWKLGPHVMACGGTHLNNTSPVGEIVAARKNLGKGMERVRLTLTAPTVDTSKYHD
jgi:Ser-tRNA(Ala) deacylase AlaX